MYVLQHQQEPSAARQDGQSDYATGIGYDLPQLLSALGSSMSVRSHLDLYTWLQRSIGPVLPHELMLSASGNFRSGDICIDVASSIPGVNTHVACSSEMIPVYLERLYKRVTRAGTTWLLEERPHPGSDSVSLALACGMGAELSAVFKSVLVCLLRDEKNGEELLFAFFSLDKKIEVNEQTLNLLLPHIDGACRRVKLLKISMAGRVSATNPAVQLTKALSGRECEIMNWVCEGKSNMEIGLILGISHNTVKNHLKKIFSKMQVSTRSQAVRIFLHINQKT